MLARPSLSASIGRPGCHEGAPMPPRAGSDANGRQLGSERALPRSARLSLSCLDTPRTPAHHRRYQHDLPRRGTAHGRRRQDRHGALHSSGVLGRSLNAARTQHFVLDSPSGPNEAVTNGEAFLAGISSCGVTLIEKYAADNGIRLDSMEATIEGVRSNAEPNRFQAINVKFEIRGVDQAQADHLVATWQDR